MVLWGNWNNFNLHIGDKELSTSYSYLLIALAVSKRVMNVASKLFTEKGNTEQRLPFTIL